MDSSDEENMKGIYDVVLSIQQSWESEEDEEQMKTFSYEESNQFPSELGTEMICEDSGLLLEED